MSTDTIVIHLPDGLHRRLERIANLTQRPLESVIVQTLSSSLPPLPDDLPAATRDALIALEHWSDDGLRDLAWATFPGDQYAQLTALREQRRDGVLSKDEQASLERLTQEADLLTLKKAYAAVLLKWRGHRLPMPAELDT
jgi:predicted transcriptional regulator